MPLSLVRPPDANKMSIVKRLLASMKAHFTGISPFKFLVENCVNVARKLVLSILIDYSTNFV